MLSRKSAGKDIAAVVSVQLKPSQLRVIMGGIWDSDVSFFVHGKPGIGKSTILKAEATSRGVAYVDLRLATKNPSQILGVPYPVEEHGQTFARYSIPAELPRDIDVDHIVGIRAAPHLIDFKTLNPTGQNDIHYCTKPEITVTSLEPELTARIVEQSLDRFYVVLEDENGRAHSGEVRYQIKAEAEALICLDELSSANPAVQVAAYSLVLERRSGEYVVPRLVRIVAAGNRQLDGAVHHRMSKALGNRFTHFELVEDYQEWDIWAGETNVYPLLREFHASNEGRYLIVFEPDSDQLAWASPRTHEHLSKLEYVYDALGVFDTVIRTALIVGTIGETAGSAYSVFKKNMNLPHPSAILKGEEIPKMRYSVPAQKYIAVNVMHSLRGDLRKITDLGMDKQDARYLDLMGLWYEQADRAVGFFVDRFAPEMVASAIRSMSKEYLLPLAPNKMPNFRLHIQSSKSATLG